MIDALVFSKDRPAQLDLLLRSIRKHASAVYDTVVVLWTVSDERYATGYHLLAGEHEETHLLPELDFEHDVRQWLRAAGPVVSFLCDDDVFYRDAPLPAVIPWSYRGGDYDYPFSVDGNVYQRLDVIRLLDGLPFRNPSELEAMAHERRKRLPFDQVEPCLPPCLVGVPMNRVSVSSGMPHSGFDTAELNRRYLAGERLAIPTTTVNLGAHVELAPVYV